MVKFFRRLHVDECFLFCVMSSGSVSSFNDEDYEVDENSDEEEQEEPGDYCKGSLRNVASGGLKWFYNSFRILYTITAIYIRLNYAHACWDPEKLILHYSVAVNLAESFVDNATVDVSKLTSSYKINLFRSVCKTGKLCCPKAQLVLKGFEIDLLSFVLWNSAPD